MAEHGRVKSRARRAVGLLAVCLAAGLLTPTPAAALNDDTGTWTGVVDWPILPLHMALTPTGEIMSYGSRPNGQEGGDLAFDVWDPALGTGTASHSVEPNGTTTDLFCSIQIMDPVRDVIFTAGGGDGNPNANGGTTGTTIYDGTTLTPQAPMSFARWYPAGTTLPNGDLLVEGGSEDGGGGSDGVLTPERFNHETGWTTLTGINSAWAYGDDGGSGIDQNRGGVDQNRWWYPRSWVAPDGNIFGVSGSNMYTLDPSGTGSLQPAGTIPGTNVGATSTAVMFRPGMILQAGGGAYDNDDYDRPASQTATVIDINGASPTLTNVANMNHPRHWGTATVLPDGDVMVSGGSNIQNSAFGVAYAPEIWDPDTNVWTDMASHSRMRLYHSSAILLPDARVLVAGGGNPGPEQNLNAEIFSPPYLYDGNVLAPRPFIDLAPTKVAYGDQFLIGTSTDVTKITFIRAGAMTHSFNSGTRFMELTMTGTGRERTVTAPATAALAPPGTYMMFALNAAGTPSVAQLVEIDPPSDVDPPSADIVINEVRYNAPAGEPDFVELHNPTASPADVSGWTVPGVGATLPSNTSIPADGFAVLTDSIANYNAHYPPPAGPLIEYSGALDPLGERLILRDDTNAVIDDVEFDDLPPWPPEPALGLNTLELTDPLLDNALATSWQSSLDPGGTPGLPNILRCGSFAVTVDLRKGQSPTSGDDVIYGTPNADIINAGAGNDVVCAEGGDDIIDLGPGNDIVDANAGADTVNGGPGNDYLYGGIGNDDLDGGADNDEVLGAEGNDTVRGGIGVDFLRGDSGIDTYFGGDGNDWLQGGPEGEAMNGEAGDDIILGEAGADTIRGGPGADYVSAGLGDDDVDGQGENDWLEGGPDGETLVGGAGDDIILGFGGNDTLTGGIGADYLRGDGGIDTFNGGDGNDWIEGGPEGEAMNGDAGDDIILGGAGSDTIRGGLGIDYVNGGAGNNDVDAGPDNDWIEGGPDGELLDGGAGDDIILGLGGDDNLRGSDGSDYLRGDDGTDSFDGGPGRDYLDGDAIGESMAGGAGDDLIYGAGGDDIITGDAGSDYLNGGPGFDSCDGGTEIDFAEPDTCETVTNVP